MGRVSFKDLDQGSEMINLKSILKQAFFSGSWGSSKNRPPEAN
jgi:hypothetical protein